MRDTLEGLAVANRVQRIRVGTCLGLVVAAGTTWLLSASASYQQAAARKWGTAGSFREAMVNVLGSPTPSASLGDEAHAFDRMVGTWDADFTFHRDDELNCGSMKTMRHCLSCVSKNRIVVPIVRSI